MSLDSKRCTRALLAQRMLVLLMVRNLLTTSLAWLGSIPTQERSNALEILQDWKTLSKETMSKCFTPTVGD